MRVRVVDASACRLDPVGSSPDAAVVGVVVAGRARLDAGKLAPAPQQVVAGEQQVAAFEQAQQLVVA